MLLCVLVLTGLGQCFLRFDVFLFHVFIGKLFLSHSLLGLGDLCGCGLDVMFYIMLIFIFVIFFSCLFLQMLSRLLVTEFKSFYKRWKRYRQRRGGTEKNR